MKHKMIHRDIKPQNILIKYKNPNSGRYLKLCDFGCVTDHRSSENKQNGSIQINFTSNDVKIETSMTHTRGVGTLGYMAPETVNDRTYNTKSDIFSISCIAIDLFNFEQ